MKRGKSFFVFLTALGLFAMTFSPLSLKAEVLPGFGGWPVYTPIPCTCSATLWSYFGLLYLQAVPASGPLVYVPYSTIPFAYYTPTAPGTPHLGEYVPGAQACWMYIGFACTVIPSIGAMAIVGTGVTGGK